MTGDVATAWSQSRDLFDEIRPKFDAYMKMDPKL